ncbi:alpha/beta hydrolase family protein [Paenibacillus sp. GCM10027626]|uniref:alpha/beta hydrolase family protein n=1 Tax=Paenibacillus sp. GCM10027626 TaxID=3273411 RepID=UPI003644A658
MRHPDHYLQAMYDSVIPKYRFGAQDEAEWESWQKALRTQLIDDLGGFPEIPAELGAVVLEEERCDGYIRQSVEFTTFPGLRMPAYVLIPEEGSSEGGFPAIVACHGHGYGSKEIVGLDPDGNKIEGDPGYQKQFAVELVKRGFLVVAPELLGFGERKMKAEYDRGEYSSCHSISTFLLQMGHTMSGHRVYEALRTVDYLQARPDVDAQRIGMMGISGGGLVVSFSAALDDRIKATVVSGYISTFKESILSIHHCVDNYIPGLSRHAELPDIISLIAPRPLLAEIGSEDRIFPKTSAAGALDRVREAYRLLGEEQAVDADSFAGNHEISGAKAYDWLVKWLR